MMFTPFKVLRPQNEKASINFIDALPESFNLFDQVLVKKDRLLPSSQNPHPFQYQLLFIFDGELKGSVRCSLFSPLPFEEKSKALKDIFQECMNVLLGQYISVIENDLGLFSTLSTGRELTSFALPDDSKAFLNFSFGYRIEIDHMELPVELNFSLKPIAVPEV